MKKLVILIFFLIGGILDANAQSSELLTAYKDVVRTFKEFDVTSVDVKEIDRFSGETFRGTLMFKEQRIRYDGTYLVVSYKQVPKKDCYANSEYWNSGNYIVQIPINEGTTLEFPFMNSSYASRGEYYSVKIKNDRGILMTKNGTKELIAEYNFAISQELTAKKFYKELSRLIELLSEERFTGKLGFRTVSVSTNSSTKKTKHQSSTKRTNSTPKPTSIHRNVNNVGNKSTKTIIK